MQWVIDMWCRDDRRSRDAVINRRKKASNGLDETRRMRYCESCESAWEPDLHMTQHIIKYPEFPTIGLKRERCKYCE